MASANAIKAGEAYVSLSGDSKPFDAAVARMGAKVRAVGEMVNRAARATALAGAGLSIPATGTILETAKIAAAGEAFGLAGEKASRLFGIMAAAGSDTRDATEGLVTFNQRIADALAGVGEESRKLFAGLGVDAKSFEGLDTADRFYALIDALKAVPDNAKRTGLLLKAVGEDAGKNLLPVLTMSEEELRKLGDAFQKTDAELKSAKDASRQYAVATGYLKGAWEGLVTAIVPAFKAVAEVFTSIGRSVGQWLRANREAIATGLTLTGVVLGVVAAVKLAGVAIAVATQPLTIMVGVAALLSRGLGDATEAVDSFIGAAVGVGAVVVVFKAVAAAIALVSSPLLLVGAIVGGFVHAIGHASGLFRELGRTFRETFGGIVAAVKKGDLGLAFEIVTTGLRAVWLQVVASLRQGWYDFANFFEDVFNDAVLAVQKFFLNMVRAVRVGFLDAIIGMANGLNMLEAKVAAVANAGKFQVAEVLIEAEQIPLKKDIEVERQREGKIQAKLAALTEGQKGHAPGTEAFKSLEASKADVRVELGDSQAKLADLGKQMDAVRERHIKPLVGGKWIDTSEFEKARDRIERTPTTSSPHWSGSTRRSARPATPGSRTGSTRSGWSGRLFSSASANCGPGPRHPPRRPPRAGPAGGASSRTPCGRCSRCRSGSGRRSAGCSSPRTSRARWASGRPAPSRNNNWT